MRDATMRRSTPRRSFGRARLFAVAAVASFALAITGCGANASPGGAEGSGPGAEGPLAELYQKAIDGGGKVVLYTHLSGTDEQSAIAQAFQEQFPDLTLEVTGLNGQQLLERFLTEKRAGQNLVDVIQYPGLEPFLGTFADEKLIEPFTPSAADAFTTEGTFIKGVAYPWSIYEQGACYNPTLVSDSELELLKTYQGWTDPVWKGRAAISEPAGGTYLRGWTYWVEQDETLGEDWLRQIKTNVDPVAFSNGNAATDRVSAGEYAVAFGVNSVQAARAAGLGAPLNCARQEYTVIIPAAMALVAQAPNPAGGQLFIEWQLSKEGQLASINASKNLSARDDLIGTPPDNVENWDAPNKTVATDEAVVAKQQKHVIDLFQSIFGAGQ